MQQRLQERVRAARAGDGGFTLIELLIVIVVLGVLAGIVVFSVNFITDRGTATACKTDVRNVQVAMEAYYAEKGSYPAGADATGIGLLVSGGYLRNPPSTDKYTIKYDGAGKVTGYLGTGTTGTAC